MTVHEGYWDCQYCGKTAIRGRHKSCPQCVRSRPEGVRFYLPENEDAPAAAEPVTRPDLLRQAAHGPDWICDFCSSSNAADLTACRHCAAPREATSPRQDVIRYDLGQTPDSGDMDPDVGARPEPAPTPRRTSQRPPARKKRLKPAAAVAGILALCLLLSFLILDTDTVPVTAAGFHWERAVVVEALETHVEEDWELPQDGAIRLVEEREAIREYEDVVVGYEPRQRTVSERVQVGERTYVCGQEDLGNGFFQDVECTEPLYETQRRTESYDAPIYEQEPVYDTLYVYERDVWVEARTASASGDDRAPAWPTLTLAPHERESDRSERYQVIFRDAGGNRYTMTLPEERWRTVEQGAPYRLRVNHLGNPVELLHP